MSSVRPFTPSFYSFSFETTKDTAGCRAFHRNYIVGGVNEDAADGFSEGEINRIIKSLKTETYQPKPARRTYIQCELCGSADSEHYEVHHINKLKNLKGKKTWEIAMIAKRRKTLVVCRTCHKMIHSQRVSD